MLGYRDSSCRQRSSRHSRSLTIGWPWHWTDWPTEWTASNRHTPTICQRRIDSSKKRHGKLRRNNSSRHRCGHFYLSRAELQTCQTTWNGRYQVLALPPDRGSLESIASDGSCAWTDCLPKGSRIICSCGSDSDRDNGCQFLRDVFCRYRRWRLGLWKTSLDHRADLGVISVRRVACPYVGIYSRS